MASTWPRRPVDPITDFLLPRFYGSTPTIFGAPRAKGPFELAGVDLAFVGIPWSAPSPDSRSGAAAANFFGTNLTPGLFRTNSLKYGGYLPELDVDVFERYRLVDYGDSDVVQDLQKTFDNVTQRISEVIQAGARPITMGGNSGPSSYAVIRAIAKHADGPTAVLNMDAHGDNMRGEATDDPPEQPRWGGTWARRILDLPGVDPSRFFHFGLRGPRNDREVFDRFTEKGVQRSHVYTFGDIWRARRGGFDPWAQSVAQQIAEGAAKVWIAIDVDVIDMSAGPDWGDEPLGPRAEEVCWLCYEVGRAAGWQKFGGISFMAVPNAAMSTHWMCVYIMLYTLAGTIHGATA